MKKMVSLKNRHHIEEVKPIIIIVDSNDAIYRRHFVANEDVIQKKIRINTHYNKETTRYIEDVLKYYKISYIPTNYDGNWEYIYKVDFDININNFKIQLTLRFRDSDYDNESSTYCQMSLATDKYTIGIIEELGEMVNPYSSMNIYSMSALIKYIVDYMDYKCNMYKILLIKQLPIIEDMRNEITSQYKLIMDRDLKYIKPHNAYSIHYIYSQPQTYQTQFIKDEDIKYFEDYGVCDSDYDTNSYDSDFEDNENFEDSY